MERKLKQYVLTIVRESQQKQQQMITNGHKLLVDSVTQLGLSIKNNEKDIKLH